MVNRSEGRLNSKILSDVKTVDPLVIFVLVKENVNLPTIPRRR